MICLVWRYVGEKTSWGEGTLGGVWRNLSAPDLLLLRFCLFAKLIFSVDIFICYNEDIWSSHRDEVDGFFIFCHLSFGLRSNAVSDVLITPQYLSL